MDITIAVVSILTITVLFSGYNRIASHKATLSSRDFTSRKATWSPRDLSSRKICPICAGVSVTWIWMLVAISLGYRIDPIVPALLMGGTVVGIAYQLEKRFIAENVSADVSRARDVLRKNVFDGASKISASLVWKAIFIPIGFVAAYGFISAAAITLSDGSRWLAAGIVAVILLLAVTVFFVKARSIYGGTKKGAAHFTQDKDVEELENKMKNCC